MANESFVAYVDESGDEGFKFGEGSSGWFVLSAVVFRSQQELSEAKLVDVVKAKFNQLRQPGQPQIPKKKPLHFRDLKHEQRRFYAGQIGLSKVRCISICIYKPDLVSPENFQNQHRLYFYATRLLVERVSWLCRDAKRKQDVGDGSVRLVFSNRSSLNYEGLAKYLESLKSKVDYRADLSVLARIRIETYSSGKRMGLQIADAIASSTFYALEPNRYGQVECGYIDELKSRFYRHENLLYGYGLKIMPREAEEKRRRGESKIPLA